MSSGASSKRFGCKQRAVAGLAGEPGELAEEPGILDQDVVLEIAEIVEAPEPGLEDGMALVAEQHRLGRGRMVAEEAGRQRLRQMRVAGGADRDLELGAPLAVGLGELAARRIEQPLAPAEIPVQRSDAAGERVDARLRLGALRAVEAVLRFVVVRDREQDSHVPAPRAAL